KTHDGREHGARRMPQTSFSVDNYHSRRNPRYPNYAADETGDSRHYGMDGYMYPAKRSTSSHAPPPHYRSRGDIYTTSAPQDYSKIPTYTSETMTSSQPLSSRSTSPPVSPHDYVPPSDSSPPSSQSSKRRLRGPHTWDHKHMVQEHLYAPDGRRMKERPGPQATPLNVAEAT
ncbi:hypothetical protein BGZ73_005823, partial [Actinomortierella ambigua]